MNTIQETYGKAPQAASLADRLRSYRGTMDDYFNQANPTFGDALVGSLDDIGEFVLDTAVTASPGALMGSMAFRANTLLEAGKGNNYDKVSGLANATLGLTTTTMTYSGAAVGSKVLGCAGPWAAVGVVSIKLGENFAPYFIQLSETAEITGSIDASIRSAESSMTTWNMHGANLVNESVKMGCADFQ